LDKAIDSMKIAIAAMTPDRDARVAKHGARAAYYLLFDNRGAPLETIANPNAGVDRGAAPRAAALLAGKDITLLAAGDFGPRFGAELERRGIEIVRRKGPVSDIVRGLID
jgi:predicted Fe-Mo cluster-binding NifX family protein